MRKNSGRQRTISFVVFALILFIVASGLFFAVKAGLFSSDPKVDIKANNSYDETLTVVMGEYYPPFSFKQDGEYIGHDVELANEIGNRLEMNVKLKFLTWAECLDAVQSGKADLIMSVDYELPEKGIIYSIPVADNPWMAFSKGDVNNYAGLYGKKIGIGENTDPLEDAALEKSYVVFSSYEPAFEALEKGRVDVVITKNPVGNYIAGKKGYEDIYASCELAGGHFAVGLREDRKGLLDRLNSIVQDMSNDGTLEKLNNKWLGSFAKRYSLMDIMQLNPEYFIIVATGILLLLALILLLVIRESASRKEKAIRDAEEAMRLIDSVASIYNIAYQVNLKEDTYKLLRMDSPLIDEPKITGFDTFTEIIQGLSGFLHPEEKTRIFHEFEYGTIRKHLERTQSYNIEYRVFIDGVIYWHEFNITKIDEDNIAVGFAEKDLEITKRHIEDKRFAQYFALYEVDIDTDTAKIVIASPYYDAGQGRKAVPYREAMIAFSNSLEGEAKEFFMRLADLDYVREQFANEDRKTYTYRSGHVYDAQWVDLMSYVTLRHEDGTPAMFSLGFSYIDSFGAARQELQGKIEAQTEQLQKALDMAQSANEAKSAFLFNMSHDIRTPMNAILGFTNMGLKNLDDKEKVKDCLIKTQKSGNLLLTLINGVLDMSRIESGSAELQKNIGDVYYSFVNIDLPLQELAATKDIDLTFEFGEITDRYVLADFNACARIFTNLISNALKYTDEGGWVKVFCEQASQPRDGVALYRYTIEDNGMGMSEEFQQQMFEAFTREQNSTISGIQGTGLGLSVTKTYVDYLDGTIECSSKPGEGTVFTVTLPFQLQEKEQYTDPNTGEVISAGEESRVHAAADFRGLKVLLVEDNELNREIAADMLEEEGLVIEEAEDGTVAVDLMREKGPDYYDYILMDIQMPVMDGYEATRAIREMYPDADIPIIAVSANAFEEDKTASREAGMDEHIAKPIDVDRLKETMAKYI